MHDDVPALAPGTTFEGRYQLLAKLGEGGFGAVHKARQLTTGQAVALKIMHLPASLDEARREKRVARFLRETRLCAELHHPNLVQLVDSGRAEGGLLYTVFAFAPGDNLADVLAKEGALAPREAKHLMMQVLDALACAHAAGVVHRDLKPRNIMVVPTGARRNALVLDFGIGAVVDREERELTRLTATNETLGTPGYAAPEQWRGLEPTPRADLFAWGLVFLECLTGRPVYAGGSAADLIYQALGPDPVPVPSEIEHHPLGHLLRAATRKDPEARDVTARGLFDALEACDVRGLERRRPAAAIAASAMSTETTARPVSAVEGERRHVTAIACNVSVEPLGPALPADALDEAQRAAMALAAGIARSHGGYVAATLGDDLLVYFGYPRAEEDDASRAARAALAVVAAVEAENERIAAAGLRLEVRIGAHAGLVVARDAHDTGEAVLAAGSTPRLAARVATLAPPGAVLVSAAAQRLLRGAFELEPEGTPRGDGTVEVFRLGRGERTTGATPAGARAPLVGRDQEIDLLLDRFRRARAGGGQCALVVGEPGIGKSRLARELRDRLSNEAHVFVEGRCSPDTRNSALFPIVELLGRALGLDREGSPAGKAAQLDAQLARHGLAPAEAMPLFLPLFSLPFAAPHAPLDVPPQKQKELTRDAILSLLAAMAEERPLLLLVEDLHWADPTTLELLGQLAREAPSTSMFLILTARPEFSPAFPTAGVLQLQLGRLERAQIEALASGLLGGKALPPAVLDRVASRTDGVPLFVEELTRMMIESGALVERGGRYELAGPLSEVEIPGTLRALLTARLDRLGRAKETAQIAAALGREFGLDVLAAVSPLGAADLEQDLDRLMGAGLVLRKRRVRDQRGVFKHALVRDAAYESLTAEGRRKVHARIAAALEDRFPAVVEARPDLLAHHHAAADQKRRAIGYAQKATQRAYERSAHVEATRQAQEAVGWLGAIADASERDEIELGFYSILLIVLLADGAAGSEDSAYIARRTLELVERQGEDRADVPTLWRLLLYYLRVHMETAGRIAARLLRIVERTQDLGQEAAVLPLLATCLWIEGRLDEARDKLERILAIYDPAIHAAGALTYGLDAKVVAHALHAGVSSFMGLPDEALRHARESVAWAEHLDHPVSLSNALLYLATAHYLRGERREVAEAAARLMGGGDRLGQVMTVHGVLYHAWATNDLAAARTSLAAVRARNEKAGMTYWLALGAEAEAQAGDHAAALDLVEDGLRLVTETGEVYFAAELHRLKAMCLLSRDPADAARAEACLRDALAVARRQGARALELRAGVALGRILRDRGSFDAARALVEPISASITEGHDLPDAVAARDLLRQLDPAV
jgi:TOMM system kinase/cyclase fusion protein